MGERSETVRHEYDGEIDSIASRIATALASLQEFPAVRFKVGKTPDLGDAPGANARSVLTQKLAAKVCVDMVCMCALVRVYVCVCACVCVCLLVHVLLSQGTLPPQLTCRECRQHTGQPSSTVFALRELV